MPEIVLSERRQQDLRTLMAADVVPGSPLPTRHVLKAIAGLIPCDDLGVALANSDGTVIDHVELPATGRGDKDPQVCDGPLPLGLQWWGREPEAEADLRADGHADAILLGFRNGPDHVAQLWLSRTRRHFTTDDLVMLQLIAPVVRRHLQEPAANRLPGTLTVQERRVLQLVATGRSNTQIAERMSIAPSTVRKHLEHIYPKLGVTNRLAAAVAFEGRLLPDPDRVDLVKTYA